MNTLQKERHLVIAERGEGKESSDLSLQYAEIGKHIIFDTAVWDALAEGGCQRVHYDLMLICAAVEFADRRWHRPFNSARIIDVTLPVLELALWGSDSVKGSLEHVLRYLTGDVWRFNFIKAKNANPCDFKQLRLYFDETEKFAIAYSEGLDSRATAALSGKESDALCLRVANTPHKAHHGDSFFTQIPFRVDKENSGRESSFRSRGFQFAAMTAIAASIRKFERIIVPESGQGALGPAMLPLLGLYADYRNYPVFFRKMEVFVAAALDHKVSFEQPRLWYTKGQTLSDFLKLDGKTKDELIDTRSCWQKRHIVNVDKRVRQCGLCAACLLRRMSLHTAGVAEPKGTYVIENLTVDNAYKAMTKVKAERQKGMAQYGIVGARHFQDLAKLAEPEKEHDLRVQAADFAEALNLEVSACETKLKSLLTTHADEWGAFIEAQGATSCLREWIAGGNR
jgi:7-cyano-7-deazaguanine synthase in queuosine biosynthesis